MTIAILSDEFLVARQNDRKAVAVRGISENIELVEELICSYENALHVYKSPYEIEREMDISRSSVRRIAKHDLAAENLYKRLSGFIVIRQMAPFYFPELFQINYELMLRMK